MEILAPSEPREERVESSYTYLLISIVPHRGRTRYNNMI